MLAGEQQSEVGALRALCHELPAASFAVYLLLHQRRPRQLLTVPVRSLPGAHGEVHAFMPTTEQRAASESDRGGRLRFGRSRCKTLLQATCQRAATLARSLG